MKLKVGDRVYRRDKEYTGTVVHILDKPCRNSGTVVIQTNGSGGLVIRDEEGVYIDPAPSSSEKWQRSMDWLPSPKTIEVVHFLVEDVSGNTRVFSLVKGIPTQDRFISLYRDNDYWGKCGVWTGVVKEWTEVVEVPRDSCYAVL
jgi:hypothetical protein